MSITYANKLYKGAVCIYTSSDYQNNVQKLPLESVYKHPADEVTCRKTKHVKNKHVSFSLPKLCNRQQNTAANWYIFSFRSGNSNLLLDRYLGKMPCNILRALYSSLYSCVYAATHSRANE